MRKRSRRNTNPEPPRLCTTHYDAEGKPEYLATPMVINGRRSWAYVKNGEVASYVTVEEANDLFQKQNIKAAVVDF